MVDKTIPFTGGPLSKLDRYILSWIDKRSKTSAATNFKFLYDRGGDGYPGDWEEYLENCLPTLNSLIKQGFVGENQLPNEYMPRLFLTDKGKQEIENS